jgi:hypothetical protein
MTQPQMMREPEDGRIESWLTERQRRLPAGDREVVLGRALQRLPHTPQRRRWRLLQWLPFGIGATRSSVPAEPHPEGSTRMIFSATRIAALVAALAVGGSLVLVAGPLSPSADVPAVPAAEAPGPEAAAWFSGTGGATIIENGVETWDEGIPQMRGQVSQVPARLIAQVSDPRMAGTQTFTQNADDYSGDAYPGFGPTWGQMRIEDDDGAWVGDVAGVWHGGGTTEMSGWLTGEGAYEGLVEYVLFQTSGFRVDFSGAIYPADAPPLELDVE